MRVLGVLLIFDQTFIEVQEEGMSRSSVAARVAVFAGLVVSVVALAVPALAAPAHATKTVTVTATEFKFKFSAAVSHGTVTFVLVNKGKLAHNFKIDGKKTPMVKPGKSASITATLKAGKYPYLCTVPGHAAGGMKGTLVVK